MQLIQCLVTQLLPGCLMHIFKVDLYKSKFCGGSNYAYKSILLY